MKQTNLQASPLRHLRLFVGLSNQRLAEIEALCAWRSYAPGELILDYLDANDDVFFLVEGEAKVSIFAVNGKAVTFSDLTSGEMFGEYAAVDGGPRSASITAATSCHVGCMSAAAFRRLIEDEPVLAMRLLRQCVGKIRCLTTRIYEFSTLAVSNRIHAELLRLARLPGATEDGRPAALSPTHAEIASRTSTHREAVSRELSRLARAGIIERRGKYLYVKDLSRLARLVHDATGE